jgi:hypothetical protein
MRDNSIKFQCLYIYIACMAQTYSYSTHLSLKKHATDYINYVHWVLPITHAHPRRHAKCHVSDIILDGSINLRL